MATLRHVIVAAAAALVLLVPAATSQLGTFGSHVKIGDTDYVPLMKGVGAGVPLALQVYRADLGRSDNAYDDCLIVDTAPSPAEDAPIKYIRLTSCFGKPPGSMVGPTDTEVERFEKFVLQPPTTGAPAVARYAT